MNLYNFNIRKKDASYFSYQWILQHDKQFYPKSSKQKISNNCKRLGYWIWEKKWRARFSNMNSVKWIRCYWVTSMWWLNLVVTECMPVRVSHSSPTIEHYRFIDLLQVRNICIGNTNVWVHQNNSDLIFKHICLWVSMQTLGKPPATVQHSSMCLFCQSISGSVVYIRENNLEMAKHAFIEQAVMLLLNWFSKVWKGSIEFNKFVWAILSECKYVFTGQLAMQLAE